MNWEQATTAFSGHSGFIVASTGRDNSGIELRLGLSSKSGPPMVELNLQGATDGGEVSRYSSGFTSGGNQADFPGSGFTFDANRWYCVEALFKGTPSEFRLWIDGADITATHVTDFRGDLSSGTPRTAWAPSYKLPEDRLHRLRRPVEADLVCRRDRLHGSYRLQLVTDNRRASWRRPRRRTKQWRLACCSCRNRIRRC
jgi:hypothetical protein